MKNKETLDRDLLTKIFKIGSMSYQEDDMVDFVKKFLNERNIKYDHDFNGNIYSIHNYQKPILNAHMDTVQDVDDENLARFAKIRKNILSSYGVLGGDDKCGIYIILHLLEKNPLDFNFILTVGEEIGGGNGIKEVEKDLGDEIKKCPYFLTLDRKGCDDILCYNNNYGTKDLQEALKKVSDDHGFKYKPGTGTFSDANTLSDYISGANLSVGYYNAHSKDEFVILSDLKNALNYVNTIIKEVKKGFNKPKKTFTYYGSGHGYSSGYHDAYDDYYDDFGAPVKKKCFITKSEVDVKYISSIDRYLSSRGVKKLLIELDEKGLLTESGPSEDFPELQEELDDEELDELLESSGFSY